MPPQLHQAGYHILDNNFEGEDKGIPTPERKTCSDVPEMYVCRTASGTSEYNTLECAGFALQIANLDRNDPPNYQKDSFFRDNHFNLNSGAAFRITAEPRMPQIVVRCRTSGFTAADFPIHWRLRCRHVLCRHWNIGKHEGVGSYRYRGVCEQLEDEWQGKSWQAEFKLFEPASNPDLEYLYNSNEVGGPVMGGHAILEVAALPAGCTTLLKDYVHLRIGGTNPGKANVLSYIDQQLQDRDQNIVHMVRAVAGHESNFIQFQNSAQRKATMHFIQKHHHNPAQPDCAVVFDWPDDPEHFPNVSFDWGVGILQYTKLWGRTIGRETVWDWRASIRRGVNEFFGALQDPYHTNITWRDWAMAAWQNYNGSGAQAQAYAVTVGASPEGQLVSHDPVPATLDLDAQTKALPDPPVRPAPPSWPPLLPPGDYELRPAQEGVPA